MIESLIVDAERRVQCECDHAASIGNPSKAVIRSRIAGIRRWVGTVHAKLPHRDALCDAYDTAQSRMRGEHLDFSQACGQREPQHIRSSIRLRAPMELREILRPQMKILRDMMFDVSLHRGQIPTNDVVTMFRNLSVIIAGVRSWMEVMGEAPLEFLREDIETPWDCSVLERCLRRTSLTKHIDAFGGIASDVVLDQRSRAIHHVKLQANLLRILSLDLLKDVCQVSALLRGMGDS